MSIRKRALSSVWAAFVEILAAAADVLPDEQHLGAGATATARNNLDSREKKMRSRSGLASQSCTQRFEVVVWSKDRSLEMIFFCWLPKECESSVAMC